MVVRDICSSERMPSCIRAPPDAQKMTSGKRFSVANSVMMTIFSPTTSYNFV